MDVTLRRADQEREEVARMTDAEAWLDRHGFQVAGEFENEWGERLADKLDEAEGVIFEGSVWPRGIFPDGSSVTARFCIWEVEE